MKYFEFFNSVLAKNLQINASFFSIYYFKISNSTDRFLENRLNQIRPILSIFKKTGRFLMISESMGLTKDIISNWQQNFQVLFEMKIILM
jgi:hypothetical protein